MKNVIVADIDDCCLSPNGRIQHYLNGDLERYHAEHHTDEPIPQGIAVYRKFLNDANFRFYFVTGRNEDARQYTLDQLHAHIDPAIVSKQLLMRPIHLPSTVMHDTELKPMLLRQIGIEPKHIFIVFEDRTSVVNMWRALGVMVYQTALGNH